MSSAEDINYLQSDSDKSRNRNSDISDPGEIYLPSEILSACSLNAHLFHPHGVFRKLLIERLGADDIERQEAQIKQSLKFTQWLIQQRALTESGNTRLDPFTSQSRSMATIYRCVISGDYFRNRNTILVEPDCLSMVYEMISVSLLSHICEKLTTGKGLMVPELNNPELKQPAVLHAHYSTLQSDINHYGGTKPVLTYKPGPHDAFISVYPLPFTGPEEQAEFCFGFSIENNIPRNGVNKREPHPDPRVMHLNLMDPGRQQLEIACSFLKNMHNGINDTEFFQTGPGVMFMGAFANALEKQLAIYELKVTQNDSSHYHHTVYFFQLALVLLAEIRKLA